MTSKEWAEMFEAIADGRLFLLNYRLQVDNKLNAIIGTLGGAQGAAIYFLDVADSEPPMYPPKEEA